MHHKTTISQISKNTYMCIGASEFEIADENTLRFRVRVDNNRRYIEVSLNGKDLYDVKQIMLRAGKIKTTYEAHDVYCDNLDEVVYRLGSTRHAAADWLAQVGIEAAA